jgi:C1A family cysteine protease
MALAFRYYKTHFAELESAYPYSSGTGKKGSCKYDSTTKTSVKVKKFSMITPNDPTALKAAIAKGPVSVAIEADKPAFQNYKSGVITGSACGTALDHGVLAVGYGTENGVEYYLVKNSWGPTWGAAGYVKIGVEAGKGVCGIQEQPV